MNTHKKIGEIGMTNIKFQFLYFQVLTCVMWLITAGLSPGSHINIDQCISSLTDVHLNCINRFL